MSHITPSKLTSKTVEQLIKAAQASYQVLSDEVEVGVNPDDPEGVALDLINWSLLMCEVDSAKPDNGYSVEQTANLFHWLCNNRCIISENSAVDQPRWAVLDVDSLLIGRGNTPEAAIEDALLSIYSNKPAEPQPPTSPLGKYVPRRFRTLKEPPPSLRIDGSEAYSYGTYFPLQDQTAWETGKWRKGKPSVEVEWIDEPPT